MNVERMVEPVQRFATAAQENRYIKSITGGLMGAMPVLMFGAVCSLIVGFPIPAWTEWVRGNALGAALQFGSDATFGLLALYAVFAIGYVFGRELKQDPLATGITSMVAFLIVLPHSTTFTPTGSQTPITAPSALPTQWLSAQGLFTAIIVAVIATRIFALISDRGWKIKMPESVPPAVARPFESVIPAVIIGALFLAIQAIFAATSFGHLSQFIYSIIGAPLSHVGDSFGAWLLIILAGQICWSLGIHNLAVWAVVLPIVIGPMTENQVAGTAGQPLPHFLTMTFVFAIYQWIGGPGSLLGLTTNMLLFAKSDRYKVLGKLVFPPSIFNIIEPVMFGFPIVYNPLMLVPFILVPIIHLTLGYLLMLAGIIGVPWVALPVSVFTMPFIPGGFLLGAGVGFGIFMIVAYLISFAIYYPFFRVADRRELKLEQEAKAGTADVAAVRAAS
jgi:PTS system cellobiose-specific IIC component